MDLQIEIEDPDQPDVVNLLDQSDAYYASLYPAESSYLLDIATLQQPEVSFFVARAKRDVKGVGAMVRCAAGYGEIKRMFVHPSARGQRIGRALLQEIERYAVSIGIKCLRLETGVKQDEAVALYASSGYTRTGPFGAYQLDEYSIFMQKTLSD
jgi:putative acetyltransferase